MALDSPTCVDIFSGCGGASLGFRLKGFRIAAALDNNEIASKTYEDNLGLEPIVEDINAISGREILKKAGLARGETTVLIGCPPCQGFSRLRKKKFDKRNKLVYSYLDIVHTIRPRYLLFENVPGILEVAQGTYFEKVCDRLYDMGYGYVTSELDAVNYGVPQFRKRVILLATRMKKSFPNLRLPSWTHCSPSETRLPHLSPWITVRQAISDLPRVSSGGHSEKVPNHEARSHRALVSRRIRAIPKNGGGRKDMRRDLWLKCHRESRENVGFCDVYGRLRWDTPSVTITSGCTNPTKGRFLHPTQNRGITTREAARLQSFPDRGRPRKGFARDFIFAGNREEADSQIGNALPVRMSEAMAGTIQELLDSSCS